MILILQYNSMNQNYQLNCSSLSSSLFFKSIYISNNFYNSVLDSSCSCYSCSSKS